MDLIPDPDKLVRRRKIRPPVEAREEISLPPDLVGDPGVSRSNRLTAREREEFQSLLSEVHSRSQEALKIFRPLPEQDRFFRSEAPERLVLGGNRGGKTLTAMVEVARAFCGQDPYDKYPKENGVFILVAKDQKKNARVFYRTLFKPGAFRIVRDPKTQLWRPFMPDEDWKLENESRPAPPLIPHRFLKGPISFGNVRDEEPKVARGKNGWELWFYSSRGEMPQGVAVDGACFDEELERESWYGEMMARLVDKRQYDRCTGKMRGGKFFWSATPQSGTPLLYDLYSRAVDEDAAREEILARGGYASPPSIESFNLTIGENPFLAEQSKDVLKNQYEGRQEEYDVRILGKFALFGSRIYPEFEPRGIHGSDVFPIPEDWCRYVFVDPGRQVCAALFVAVPPPSHPWRGRKVVYDEIYLRFCNAAMFADALTNKAGLERIERGFIDHRAGRMTEVGSGFTIEYQYMMSLKAKGFSFQSGGVGFTWAADDVKAGISAVQGLMHIVEGRSELVVFYEKCPKLLWEMERYSYKRQPNGIVVSDEPIKRHDHACFVAGTPVNTLRGLVPIESVKIGDFAKTRFGWSLVVDSCQTSNSAHVVRVEFEDGRFLIATPNHPLFVDGQGYTPIHCLVRGSVVLSESGWGDTCQNPRSSKAKLYSTKGLLLGGGRTPREERIGFITGQVGEEFLGSMSRFGRICTEKFRTVITSIIRMGTRLTTIHLIWSVFQARSTFRSMLGIGQRIRRSVTRFISRRSEISRPSGILPRRGWLGIQRTAKRCGETENFQSSRAFSAVSPILPESHPDTLFVPTIASRPTEEQLGSMMLIDGAQPAVRSSGLTSIPIANTAPLRVRCVTEVMGEHEVYNLTVEGDHEYFANGVLASNCDCLRYLAMSNIKYVRPRKRDKAENYALKALAKKRERQKHAKIADGTWNNSVKLY